MAYTPTTWVNDVTALNATHMNHLEAGVDDVDQALADHLADTSDAHAASAISVVDSGTFFTGTDVEAVLQELGPVLIGSGVRQTYTPTLTASSSNPTLGSGSSATGYYVQNGELVSVQISILFGSSGAAAGSGTYRLSLPPVTPHATQGRFVGSCFVFNDGTARIGVCDLDPANTRITLWTHSTTGAVSNTLFTSPNDDQVHASFWYIAA